MASMKKQPWAGAHRLESGESDRRFIRYQGETNRDHTTAFRECCCLRINPALVVGVIHKPPAPLPGAIGIGRELEELPAIRGRNEARGARRHAMGIFEPGT